MPGRPPPALVNSFISQSWLRVEPLDGIRASERARPLRVACFSVNMTHAALAISRRPRQELMSLPFLSHSCGKRKPPYFPRTDLSRRRLKSHVSPEITTFSCSPSRVYFCFSVGRVNFQTLNCALPSLLWRRSTCARMNRKWRRALRVSPRRLLSPTV